MAGKIKGVRILVREELFRFVTMRDWVVHAPARFRQVGHTSGSTICVDANGLVCARGKQFNEAVYPVRVFSIDDPPFKPLGMIGKRLESS
jgi:hypothetical protein